MRCQLCNNRCFSRPWLFSTPQMVFFLYFAIFSEKIDNTQFITARKRSLGQGNMFTGVCLSIGGGGCLVPGGSGPRGCLVWGVPGPGGCLLQGVPAPGGCLLVGGGSGPGGAWWRPPPRRPLLWAVHILLECILVYFCFLSS